MINIEKTEAVREKVRAGYEQIAKSGGSCCSKGSNECGTGASSEELARVIGYSAEDLSALPEGANMGLSCGNPNALALLKPGETVLDLGSGGGFDVIIAGRAVGATGRAIGVDMAAEMLQKARKNLAAYEQRSGGLRNVEFRLGEIEHLPVADASVDVVISNCVINLSPDKSQVWREIARVLKPGGRVAVSDLAHLKPLFGDGGGVGGLRGWGSSGERDRADGARGGTDGDRVEAEGAVCEWDGGLAGPAVSEGHCEPARGKQGERLYHEPGGFCPEGRRGMLRGGMLFE